MDVEILIIASRGVIYLLGGYVAYKHRNYPLMMVALIATCIAIMRYVSLGQFVTGLTANLLAVAILYTAWTTRRVSDGKS